MVNNKIVSEIEKCYNECLKRAKVIDSDYWNAKADAYRNVLVILDDTIEVKEVDLEREIDNWICDNAITHEDCSVTDVISTAKHFFELGIQQSKNDNNKENLKGEIYL